MPPPQTPQDIVIVGGSLAALMHGIMLKRLGYNVHILEQTPGAPQSQAAGIGTALQVKEFLNKHDLIQEPVAIPTIGLRYVNPLSQIVGFVPLPMQSTSWDALFYRLRANFDGLKSEYSSKSSLPVESQSNGKAVYDSGKTVTDLSYDGDQVTVYFEDSTNGQLGKLKADLVIGADGANSIVRRKVQGRSAGNRPYAGYVAWRGQVPEMDVSQETRDMFHNHVTFGIMNKEYILCYNIPGKNGSMAPGKRILNFVWYTNQSKNSLTDIMTDINGHIHRNTVPTALVRPSIWEKQQLHGTSVLAPPFKELITQTTQPFLQAISDTSSSSAAYFENKVLLVGDALFLFRPNIAFSTNQAAFDALELEKYMKGEISISDWERRVLQFGRIQWLRSIWWGEYYQRGKYWAVPAALRYFVAVYMVAMRNYFERRFGSKL